MAKGRTLIHRKFSGNGFPQGLDRNNDQMADAVAVVNLDDYYANSSVQSSAVVVGTTATLLPAIKLNGRKKLHIYNDNQDVLYIGGSGVTVDNGLPIPSGLEPPLHPLDIGAADIYGVYPSGSGTVRLMELA